MKRSWIQRSKRPMRRISPRRVEEEKIYRARLKPFLKARPFCEIWSHVCTWKSTCRHHVKGRVGKLFLDERWQKASCSPCNLFLETAEGKKWGYANGHRLDRIGISAKD